MKMSILMILMISSNLLLASSYNINWGLGVNGSAASLTIQVGDTVTWTISDSFTHTVTSLAGAAESFNSGTLSGVGQTFTHVFTQVGSNDYHCNFHPGSMFGTITVESIGSLEDNGEILHSIYPNPTEDHLYLAIQEELVGKNFVIMDIRGEHLLEGTFSDLVTSVDLYQFTKGIYLLHIPGVNRQNSRVIKQ